MVIITGALVLLAWIPLRQKPGIGTVSNVIVVGLAVDIALALSPTACTARLPAGDARRSPSCLNAVAGAAYIGADLGPGPRDGLMTGLVRKTGASWAWSAPSIEVSVLAVGFLLGGTVGLGTVVYALSIGPLLQLMLPAFTIKEPVPALA